MIRTHFASFAAFFALTVGALASACTATSTTQATEDDAGTTLPSGSSSGKSSSGKHSSTSSSSSGGSSSSSSTSSSGGSSTSSSGSTSSSSGATSSSGSTTSSSGVVFPKDASVPDANQPNACPDNTAVTAADLDAQIGWKSAVTHTGACTAADLTTLQNNFNNPGIASYFDLGTGLSATCQACVISKDTDANWQPIVGTAADNGATGFVNFGACFGSVEGAACGKSVQYEQFCTNIQCNDCTTATENQQCVTATLGAGAICSGFANSTTTNCPNLGTTSTTCGSVLDAVKKLCQ